MRLAHPALTLLLALATGAIPAIARADDPTALYHATESTVACADADAARALTDPDEARRKNPAWVKSMFDRGRCVSVTVKSPWRLVSRDGDLAMMDYAGTLGPPGSYYFRVSEMIDPNGTHPGDAPATASQPAKPGQAPAGTGTASSETALAPSPPPPAATPAAPPAGGPPTTADAPPATWGVTNILLLVIALLLAGLGGFVIGRWGRRT